MHRAWGLGEAPIYSKELCVRLTGTIARAFCVAARLLSVEWRAVGHRRDLSKRCNSLQCMHARGLIISPTPCESTDPTRAPTKRPNQHSLTLGFPSTPPVCQSQHTRRRDLPKRSESSEAGHPCPFASSAAQAEQGPDLPKSVLSEERRGERHCTRQSGPPAGKTGQPVKPAGPRVVGATLKDAFPGQETRVTRDDGLHE